MHRYPLSRPKFPLLARVGTAALFTFFLVYSTPHRVHHLFENTQKTPCAVYTISQGCHADQTEPVVLPLELIVLDGRSEPQESRTRSVTLSPFSQRAPPLT